MTDGLRVAVFGASGGIGQALVQALLSEPDIAHIHAGSRKALPSVDPRVSPFAFDLTDEASIKLAASEIATCGLLDWIIVATGELRAPEKGWHMQDGAAYARAFAVNATGPALIGKHVLPLLRRDRRALFAALSAKVGSIADNRSGGWHAYRASKAALNMIVRNFALELAARNPLAVAVTLHPGTVATALSHPFTRNTNPDQLQSPASAASHILLRLQTLSPEDSGGFYAWDGTRLPY